MTEPLPSPLAEADAALREEFGVKHWEVLPPAAPASQVTIAWPLEGKQFGVATAPALRFTYADFAGDGVAVPLLVTVTPMKSGRGRSNITIEQEGTAWPSYCRASPTSPRSVLMVPGDKLRLSAAGGPTELRVTAEPRAR